jgi:hypothetical protein
MRTRIAVLQASSLPVPTEPRIQPSTLLPFTLVDGLSIFVILNFVQTGNRLVHCVEDTANKFVAGFTEGHRLNILQ